MEGRHLCKADKYELETLARDFRLMDGTVSRKEVQEIINTCTSYSDGLKKILGVFDRVYMQ